MKISTLRDLHFDRFNEARSDLDWTAIAAMLDSGRANDLCTYMRDHFEATAEAVVSEGQSSDYESTPLDESRRADAAYHNNEVRKMRTIP